MRVFLTTACAVAAAVVAAPTVAATPTPGSGTFAVQSSTLSSFRTAGPITFFVFPQIVQWTGPINGTSQETLYVTLFPSGNSVFRGIDVCNCVSAAGEPGTLTFRFEGQDNGLTFSGSFVIISGTGGLAGFRGHGTLQGSDTPTVTGTYSGMFGS